MTVTTTPPRSLAQRMDALNRANEIRIKRAQLKRDVKAVRKDVVELLLAPPWWLETGKVWDIVLAVPKYGRVKARKMFEACEVSPSKTFGGLSDRQRRDLVAALRDGVLPARRRHGLAMGAFAPGPDVARPAPKPEPLLPSNPSQEVVERVEQLRSLEARQFEARELGDFQAVASLGRRVENVRTRLALAGATA